MSEKIPRIRKRISFGDAAMILVVTSFIAQILGFLRTKLINANFIGANVPPDQNAGVYFAAFVLPDFFYFTIAAGALGVAFMPYLSDRLHRGDRKSIWEFSGSLLNFLSIVLFGVGVVTFIFADVFARWLVHGYTPDQLHNVALMMRILALNPLIFSISGVIAAVEQTFGRFFFYAIAPLFYNACIIISIFVFKHSIGIVGLAIGAVAGALLQLLVILIGTYGLGFSWKPMIRWRERDFKQMVKQLPARSLDQGLDQVQVIVETKIASSQILGGATAVSNYNNAYVLHTAPILLIGTAISTAFFPRMNARLSQGRPDLFRKEFLRTLRLLIWITLPVVVVSFFARAYLVRLIFSRNSTEISIIFGSLALAILFRTLYAIISRWFYAQKDTRTPLVVSIIVIALNVILAYTLSRSYGLQGLAIAQSIVAGVEVIVLSTVMLIRDPKLFDRVFLHGVFRIISVTGFSLVVGYLAVQRFPLNVTDTGPFALGGKLFMIALSVFLVHVLISWMFGLEEAKILVNKVRNFIYRPVKVEE
jgi:putative peptidoglycan lipid II flippase